MTERKNYSFILLLLYMNSLTIIYGLYNNKFYAHTSQKFIVKYI